MIVGGEDGGGEDGGALAAHFYPASGVPPTGWDEVPPVVGIFARMKACAVKAVPPNLGWTFLKYKCNEQSKWVYGQGHERNQLLR